MVDTVWVIRGDHLASIDLTRRIRRMRVFSEVLNVEGALNRLSESPLVQGVILAYTETSDYNDDEHLLLELQKRDIPVLINKNYQGLHNHASNVVIVENEIVSDEQLKNFLFKTCQITKLWNLNTFVEQQVHAIKEQVQDKQVILGLSGGVDSSVLALLLAKAIDQQLICIFIDHGLLREQEAKQVKQIFQEEHQLNLKVVDAKTKFLSKLKDVTDPEMKRKIIGETFIKIFEQEAQSYDDVAFLAQGTLYTDILESGKEGADLVKSHHNVGGLPQHMQLQLIEPFALLFKDEVRHIGLLLKLNETIIKRQPFPGPGLAIRIIGEVTQEKIEIVQKSDTIYHRILKEENLTHLIWQSFTVCTNIKSVGVRDGKRSYAYTVALRAIQSVDGLDGEVVELPVRVLKKIALEITKSLSNVNRVVYDVTNKPPATIEYE